jgi:DNA polymerase III alpha subunit (gram-positive type)
MGATNQHLEVVDEIYLLIKPEAPFDLVEDGALKVNKINIAEHVSNPKALTYAQARAAVHSFMAKNGNPKFGKGQSKPMVLGHNVHFDLGFIHAQLVEKAEFERYFGYHVMDTLVACTLLKKAGWLPPEVAKLDSLVKHFGVQDLGAHNAKADTLMTLNVFGKMIEMLKTTKDSSGGSSVDLLSLLER